MRRNLPLLCVFQFLRNLQLFGAVAVPFYLEWGGLDYTRMFVLEGAFSLFMFLLEVPTGALADRFGRKGLLLFGALASAGGLVTFGGVRSYSLFFVANLLCAVGWACVSGADQALLYDSLLADGRAQDGRRALSRLQAFGTAGLLVGLPLGAWVAGSAISPRPESLAWTFRLSGVVCLFSAVPILLLREPPRAEKSRDSIRDGLMGVRALLLPGALRRVALSHVLVSATGFFMFWFYQSLAAEASLGVEWNGVLGAGLNVVGLLLLWNAGRLEAFFGLPKLLFATALVPGLLYLLLGAVRWPVFSLPAAFVIVGMKVARGPLLADLINQRVESRNRATILSGVSMLERAVIFLLYPIVGRAADASLSLAFALLGGLTVVFALFFRLPNAGGGWRSGTPQVNQ